MRKARLIPKIRGGGGGGGGGGGYFNFSTSPHEMHSTNISQTQAHLHAYEQPYYTLLNLLTHLVGGAPPPGHPFDVVDDGPPRRLPRLLEGIRHAFVVHVGCGVAAAEGRLLKGEEEGVIITYFSNEAVGSLPRKGGFWITTLFAHLIGENVSPPSPSTTY